MCVQCTCRLRLLVSREVAESLCSVALDTGPLECPQLVCLIPGFGFCTLGRCHTEVMFRWFHCIACEEIHAVD